MTPTRRLAYRFLSLPYQVRLSLADDLGLLEAGDEGEEDAEKFRRVFLRAEERGELARFWDAIESRHADPAAVNPFARGPWAKLADSLDRHLLPADGSIAERLIEILRQYIPPRRPRPLGLRPRDPTFKDLLRLDGDELAAVAYALEIVATGEPEEFGPGSLRGDFSGPEERD